MLAHWQFSNSICLLFMRDTQIDPLSMPEQVRFYNFIGGVSRAKHPVQQLAYLDLSAIIKKIS
jgi:hypothetical protein